MADLLVGWMNFEAVNNIDFNKDCYTTFILFANKIVDPFLDLWE